MANTYRERIEAILSSTQSSARSGFGKLPDTLKSFLEPLKKPDILQLLAGKGRTARIAVYSEKGSGRGTAINSLLGEQALPLEDASYQPTAQDFIRGNWSLTFITLGRPIGKFELLTMQHSIKSLVEAKPDVLLVVKEGSNPVFDQDESTFLLLLREAYHKARNRELPVILVVNKPDSFQSVFEQAAFLTTCCVANEDQEELLTEIYMRLPEAAQLSFAGRSDCLPLKIKAARNLIWLTSLVAGASCFTPLPGFDAMVIHNLQINLVELVQQIRNHSSAGKKATTNFVRYLGPIGLSETVMMLSGQAAKMLVGPLGMPLNLNNAATAIGSTMAVGEAALAYHINGTTIEKAKEIFEEQSQIYENKFRKSFSFKSNRSNPTEGLRVFKLVGDEYRSQSAPIFLEIQS